MVSDQRCSVSGVFGSPCLSEHLGLVPNLTDLFKYRRTSLCNAVIREVF